MSRIELRGPSKSGKFDGSKLHLALRDEAGQERQLDDSINWPEKPAPGMPFAFHDEAGQRPDFDIRDAWEALRNEFPDRTPFKSMVKRGKKYTKPKKR